MRYVLCGLFAFAISLSIQLAQAAEETRQEISCPVTDTALPYPDGISSVYKAGVVESTHNKLYRVRWPSTKSDGAAHTPDDHPTMLVASFQFSGAPAPAAKPRGGLFLSGDPPDVPLYKKVDAITIEFVLPRHGPNCKLSVPLKKFPYMHTVDPTSFEASIHENPDKFDILGRLYLQKEIPDNLLNDRIFRVSFAFGIEQELAPEKYYDQCANFDPATGKPTHPLWGTLFINFEERKPTYRVSPDCQKWRKDKFGKE